MERQHLIANDGMVLTNGTIYGRQIYLAQGMSTGEFYEISEGEYEKLLAVEEDEVSHGEY